MKHMIHKEARRALAISGEPPPFFYGDCRGKRTILHNPRDCKYTKVLCKPPIKAWKPMETPHLTHDFRYRPLLNGLNIFLINFDSISTNNKVGKAIKGSLLAKRTVAILCRPYLELHTSKLDNLGSHRKIRRFIQNFSKIALPLSKLLQQDVEFVFDQPCIEAFLELEKKRTTTLILQAPNWEFPFELMCDASNLALGAVLAYACRTLDSAQDNYTTIEKELLAIVFALEKFRSYLLGSKIVVFSNHAALKFLLKKPDAKPRLIRWMLLLQLFDIEIGDKSGAKNLVVDHLSRIERRINPLPIIDDFPDEQLMQLDGINLRFADIVNYLIASILAPKASRSYKDKIKSDAKYYVWDDPYLWKFCNDQASIMGHTEQLGRWVEAKATKTNDAKVVVDLFGVPKALISDQGSLFYNKTMSTFLEKYGVVYMVDTPSMFIVMGDFAAFKEKKENREDAEKKITPKKMR
ncbi:Retrovirus-related Pol polyprotein from transposon 17.6, partial [Mucuna pruriens]